MKNLSCLLFLGIVISSCNDEYSICELPTEVRLRAGFYTSSGGVEQIATVNGFTLSVLGSASPIYNQQPNLSKFVVSLNPSVSNTQYTVIIQQNIIDTVTLSYSTQKISMSEVCPDIYIHNLAAASTTKHFLDSVKISSTEINTTQTEHLKVFL